MVDASGHDDAALALHDEQLPRLQRGTRRVGGRIDAADPAGAGPAALLAVENAVVDHRDGRVVARLALADGMHRITLLLFI